jgi:3-phenylpropionate/trans-cinnamate dioxygenase ferredoxin subunit
MAKHVIAALRDFPPGTRRLVEVQGRGIVVFNIKGEFFALANRCPHQGGSLCHGRLTGLVESQEPGKYRYTRRGEIIRCAWHGWEFDVRTGKSWCDPSRVRARQFPVSVAPGAQLVEGPYVAETFTVGVEDDYVVLEA